jgi:hypothetical protein
MGETHFGFPERLRPWQSRPRAHGTRATRENHHCPLRRLRGGRVCLGGIGKTEARK